MPHTGTRRRIIKIMVSDPLFEMREREREREKLKKHKLKHNE